MASKISNYNTIKRLLLQFIIVFVFNLIFGLSVSADENVVEPSSNAQVIQSFTSQESEESELVAIADQEKRLIMFLLGVPLLVFLFATGALGIAMGIYDKDVFVAHMICAGFSMTLALAHAVVGVVWFYPF